MVEFRIDIVGDARQVDRSLNQLEQRLGRVEQETTDVNNVMRQALSRNEKGSAEALSRIGTNATQAGRGLRGLTAEQERVVENIRRQENVEKMRLALTRAAARERAEAERLVARENRKAQESIREQTQQTGSAVSGLRRQFAGLLAGFTAAIAVREFVQTSDQLTNVRNRLRLVTESERELIQTQNELLAISERTRSSFDGTAAIFSRLAVSADELGTNNQELLAFTESLNQAIILSGASATEANAGLIQLSQGLASGALRGDELRSVLEQLPAVADVIAQELGVTRGELRELGTQGKITSDIILRAFANARGELADRFATTVPTVGQALQVLGTQATGLVGSFNDATGSSELLAKGILLLGENLETVSTIVLTFSGAIGARLALQAIPAAITALSGLSVATFAAGGAFTLAGGAVFIFAQRLQALREDIAAIEEANASLVEDAKFGQLGAQISNAQREINQLNRQIAAGAERGVEASETQIARIAELKDRISDLRGEVRGQTADQRAAAAEAEAAAEAQAAQQAALDRQKKLLEEIQAPGRNFAALQEDLGALLEQNRISQEQFNIALQAGREAFERSTAAPQQADPFGDQLESIREQNQLLEDRNAQGQFVARALEIERQLRAEGVELTREQQSQLANLLLVQDQLTQAARDRQIFETEAQRIAARTQELEILATTQAGARQEALLIEARLRARGVELTDDQVNRMQRLIEAQEELNTAANNEARIQGIRDELGAATELEQKLRDLEMIRQREPELAEAAGRAYRDLRLQQLDAATDLESGFQRAFLRIQQEAEDLAQVGEDVVNVFANRAADAIADFVNTGKFNFRDFASSILQDITRIITRLLVVQALNAAINSFGGGGGGALNSVANTALDVGSQQLNAGRASGGTVQPGQAPFPVGEEGPEIFVPRQTGTIIPNPASVQQPAPVVNLSVNNVTNPNEVSDEINSGNADEAFVNMITRRRNEIIQTLGIQN